MRALRFIAVFGLIALTAAATSAVRAQTYPDRPVTVLIPFAPGGGTDAAARGLAPVWSAKLGQSIVLENVSGGAGNIASARTARSAPDGYTLIMHNVAFALNAALFRQLPFDPMRDFAPIAFINATPLVNVGRRTLPVNSVPELVAWMKNNRAKYANPGVGSTGHIAGVLLAQAVGAPVDFIPYRGGGPALSDTIAGHVDMTNVTLQNAIEPVNAGLVKGLGITSRQRAKSLPQVPSLVEELGPNQEVSFWNLLLAPAGTPAPVIDKLLSSLDAALADASLRESWEKAGIDIYPKEQRTPDAARAMLQREIDRWTKVVQENKVEAPQ